MSPGTRARVLSRSRRNVRAGLVGLLAISLFCLQGAAASVSRPLPGQAHVPLVTPGETGMGSTSRTGTDCESNLFLSSLGNQAPPADLVAMIGSHLDDRRFDGVTVGLSIWMQGYGEVAAHQPDRLLLPASNQKIVTAMGALSLLDPDHRLVTSVVTSGPVSAGRLDGDLVLVGGGDPTLASRGSHSLAELASRVRAAGILEVAGGVLVDETRYDDGRRAPGWLDWQVPAHVGPLSALTVDENKYREDPSFLADPALAAGELFTDALATEGVTVRRSPIHGSPEPPSVTLATLRSPTVAELVERILRESNNAVAELLLKEIGLTAGSSGSTLGGVGATDEALAALCLSLDGVSADGSGLSRANRRSAREWRSLLQAAQGAAWWAGFSSSLPVAGRSGTLSGRFGGTVAEGALRAKTGSIVVGRALSGMLTTAGGREVFFSVITNGARPAPSTGAIDDLLADLAADRH